MRRWIGLAWMAGGVLLGTVLAVLITGLMALPFGLGRSTVLLDHLPTSVLGRALFGPASPSFVADSRSRWGGGPYLEFYPKAVPAGDTLCRVSVHTVFLGSENHPARLNVDDRYGLENMVGSHCSDFRDFGNLFQYVGSGRPEETVTMLEAIRRDAQDGDTSFETRCTDRTGSCDPFPTLRTLNPRHIAWIEPLQWEEGSGDRIFIHADGDRKRPPGLELAIRSRRSGPRDGLVVQEVTVGGALNRGG
ncbi:hypothetical protein [Brevundimonas sp.]|uniref:hypothetical protein n=1 Tax=Brevundimonas sp. TaxID=1871086 RepID=UPI002D739ACC|nr:hypothetical protein [Brevundimonas sp.]HYD26408.1 hypothetical protein [Brevundimonas sp.]